MPSVSSIEKPIDYDTAIRQVSAYLEKEFLSGNFPGGTRLPTVRGLSRALKVSPAAVHAVYRRLREDGKLVSTVGRGTFIAPRAGRSREAQDGKNDGKISLALSCSLSMPSGGSAWSNTILSELMTVAGRSDRRIALIPFTRGLRDSEATVDLLLEEINDVDGMLLFPILSHSQQMRIREAYGAAGKPVIQFNAPAPVSTENFVSPDYYTTSFLMAKALLATGRRNFLYLGPVSNTVSSSAVQRIFGLQSALAEFADGLQPRLIQTGVIEADGASGMRKALESGYVPDVVYAFGDYIAKGALEVLQEQGLKVPEEVSVIGGSGLLTVPGLTTTRQPYTAIAETAIELIFDSLDSGGKPVPGRYLPMGFHLNATTRPEENEALCQLIDRDSDS